MFEKLFAKIRNTASTPNSDTATTDTDGNAMQLALAALFVEAARADENYEAHEKVTIDKFLMARFSLDASAAETLRNQAETAQENAIDIQRFTKTAKGMESEDKIGFIEELWTIVLSDGTRDPFEDTLVRRICGLIYVSDLESGAARARVAAKLDVAKLGQS